jgi:hypothetical protein
LKTNFSKETSPSFDETLSNFSRAVDFDVSEIVMSFELSGRVLVKAV